MKTRLLIVLAIILISGTGMIIINHYISERQFELENTLGQLKGIFGSCDCQADPNRTCPQPLIDWQNSTHYIDNNICEFITLEEHYESTDRTQYFFKVGDLFYWQNLQTGETISPSGTFTAIFVTSLGPILIVLFIIIYAVKKKNEGKK